MGSKIAETARSYARSAFALLLSATLVLGPVPARAYAESTEGEAAFPEEVVEPLPTEADEGVAEQNAAPDKGEQLSTFAESDGAALGEVALGEDESGEITPVESGDADADAGASRGEVPALSAQSTIVSSPRVVEDEAMESGQVATWDCVWLGSYPQTYVDDAATVAALDAATGWDANGDLDYDGATYRRLQKADATYSSTGSDYWSWNSKASPEGYCYFRWEPIKWRVLRVDGDTALVTADVALDDQRYNPEYGVITWEKSSLRSWLNGYDSSSNQPKIDYSSEGFANVAFSSAELDAVLTTAVTNNGSYLYPGRVTNDQVFLLSSLEVSDAAHGFSSSYLTYDEGRRCRPSDYARAMGTRTDASSSYSGSCSWWLRTMQPDTMRAAINVYADGRLDDGDIVYEAYYAIRPALTLDLSSPLVAYAGTVSSDGTMDEEAYTGGGGGPDTPADPNDLSEATIFIDGIDAGNGVSVEYAGAAVEPEVAVWVPSDEPLGTVLVEGTDYSLTLLDNDRVGTATVLVTGMGSYSGSKTVTFEVVSKGGKHYVAGYSFLEDSYSFENYSAEIEYGYWETLYESGAARLFWKNGRAGGLCFGMTLSTASMFASQPSASSFSAEGDNETRVRDLKLVRSFQEGLSGGLGGSSVHVNSGVGSIPLDSFIKYEHIYQFSSEATEGLSPVWRRGGEVDRSAEFLSHVKERIDDGALDVTVRLQNWRGGHRVLAVGYEGNDVLIDDPNNANAPERLTVNPDGTWSFSGYGGFSSDADKALLAYESGAGFVTRVWQLLLSGTGSLRGAEWASGDSTGEALVEGMERLDANSTLLRVDASQYQIDNQDTVSLESAGDAGGIIGDAGVDTTGMYWVLGTNEVSVSSVSGGARTVEVGADEVLVTAAVPEGSDVSAAIDGAGSRVEVASSGGGEVSLSFEVASADGKGDVVVTVTGTAMPGGASAGSVDGGYAVSGLYDVTATVETPEGAGEASAEGLGGGEVTVLVDEGGSSVSIGEPAPANPFRDVAEKTPHHEDILWLADSGVSAGWTEKDGTRTFRPTNTVIRQDMAAFLFRLAKLWGLVDDSWQPTGSVTFKDVSPATPHYREIMWLAESGVSAGWAVEGGREFRPRNTVVRQDMAAFLRRLQALRDPSVKTWKPTGASPFRDVTSSTPHSEDILWLAESGVSAGWKVGDTKEFRPTNTVIRQDMAAFLHRLDRLG